MGVETFGFYVALAVKTEAALPAVFRGMFLRGLLRSGWCRKDEKLAVGKDAVYVEQKKCNFLCACFRHFACFPPDAVSIQS